MEDPCHKRWHVFSDVREKIQRGTMRPRVSLREQQAMKGSGIDEGGGRSRLTGGGGKQSPASSGGERLPALAAREKDRCTEKRESARVE